MTTEITPTSVQVPSGLEFEVNQPSGRRKLALAARCTAVFPYVIFSFFWLPAAFAASFVAWFAILITGQYPSGLFAFNARAVRFLVRGYAYIALVVDARPSMTGGADPTYPLQVEVTRLPTYNRLLTAFRIPILIPFAIVHLCTTFLGYAVFIPSLLMVTLTRHQPAAFQRVLTLAVHNYARYISSAFLLTEIWWVNQG